jgi:hypothetical protein
MASGVERMMREAPAKFDHMANERYRGSYWSGRRDLNPGPLTPQAGNGSPLAPLTCRSFKDLQVNQGICFRSPQMALRPNSFTFFSRSGQRESTLAFHLLPAVRFSGA